MDFTKAGRFHSQLIKNSVSVVTHMVMQGQHFCLTDLKCAVAGR